MSAQVPPTIPPRPVRAQQAAELGASHLPEIPPRPSGKKLDRSISPANYPPSPFNEPHRTKRSSVDPIQRSPSVQYLPTPGEEGMEYANLQYRPDKPTSAIAADAVEQTRSVGEDLKLHAPKPSLPSSSAQAQVQAVTRTDAQQAALHGLGKPAPAEESLTRTRSRPSVSRPASAASGERKYSVQQTEEQGPAELGMRVPINPLLGDVQAPSPAPHLTPQATGDSTKRSGRRKSAIGDSLPPGSYGLHGHGVVAQDKFERDWYNKHPDQLEHEEGRSQGVYEGIGSGRGNFALSSDELNKIVRDSASRGHGFGTSGKEVSYPDEQIGYMASEQYQKSRHGSPQLEPTRTRSSTGAPESPLRKLSFPSEDAIPTESLRKRSSILSIPDHVTETSSDGTEHIEAPARRYNKVTGGEETMKETDEARPYVTHPTSRDYDVDENGYRVPILAEDEVAKDVGGDQMQPAVSPKYERSDFRSGEQTPGSRPSSRPGSIYQLHSASHSLSRFLSHQDDREHVHTPLEDVAEYEPLFPEEEAKGMTTAERFKKRPDLMQRRFPSQDIWEEEPSSRMYEAEVSTPDLPAQTKETKPTFEPPEAEAARKGEVSEEEKRKLVPNEERLAKSRFAPHLRDDMPTRPGMAPRFPSQDVWEDSPDSSHLVTTVNSAQRNDEDDEASSPVSSKPPIPARPEKNRLGEGASPAQIAPSVQPNLPARPPKRLHAVPPADAKLTDPVALSKETSPSELRKTPSIPDRPKPQVPPRPGKKPAEDGLTKVGSKESADGVETQRPVVAPPEVKTKPQVPARPVGSNIANLRGNFMQDLNKKLGLGPPKEKEPEPEPEPEEAKPLEDARKGRARGPQRRAPAKSPSAAAAPVKTVTFSLLQPITQWSIDDDSELDVPSSKPSTKGSHPDESKSQNGLVDKRAEADGTNSKAEEQAAARPDDAPRSLASGLATNTAGEPADPVRTPADDKIENELPHEPTASAASGQPLERTEIKATGDAVPTSRQTTTKDVGEYDGDRELDALGGTRNERMAEDEPVVLRNEQVNSSPAAQSVMKDEFKTTQSALRSGANPDDFDLRRAKSGEQAKEPMTEEDVSYKRLEDMTAKADGKLHAPEEGTKERKENS